MKRKVVISGVECITSLGKDVETTWRALTDGVSGISKIDRIDNVEKYQCQFGGEIKKFNAKKSGLTGTNTMLRYNQYELFTIFKAVTDYGWLSDLKEDTINCPVFFGNQCINLDEELFDTLIAISGENAHSLDFSKIGSNLQRFPPLNGVKLLPTLPTHFTAKKYNLHGSANVSYAGESSSIEALLRAAVNIEMGYYEKAIVASTFSPFSAHEFLWLSDSNIAKKTSMGNSPNKLIYPFDRRHDGIIFGEGSGVILIESEENARKNGRTILANIKGGSTNIFPGDDFYELTKHGFIKNIEATLSDCSIRNTDIDIIYCSAPSYPQWDNAEIEAIDEMWGRDSVQVTSSKANIGFLSCAAGLIDCIFAVQSINENKFAKTLNFEQLDNDLHIDCNKYFNAKVDNIQRCLINSAGSGAHYSSIILEKGCV
ncbi:Beta-ketoacyl-acyl-carrier-protein synthase I [Ruminiclostridium papyrosolvens DSM 2782]|uniref:Beta-ketoacyl-acyl-carrier-protein synthase I n=1 Tax=Ruminiclostridium papyrosolvens DSM 2782 TaxID=588581 RepID=F1TDR2_9FIRM|nr:beta-ketoacyl synthase [Ruminiclostridium papyrosolvens]EGD47358.1 Beta-ketoacyl-acyl-carrier-protein synthase I [Ruminiclostridium papyrosolvens DSM 2782]WES34704.1 beta-ketoacyl synthase [Ruminiclostridium papyrosolvens DSM 2782]